MERRHVAGTCEFVVQPVSVSESCGVEHDHGVEMCALVVGANAFEVLLHEHMAGDTSGAKSCLRLCERGFFQVKRPRSHRRLLSEGVDAEESEQNQGSSKHGLVI
jgi:hypothetical protein